MDTDKYLVFFRKRIEPFIALGVLILLLILAFQLYQGNNLRTEISQSCGWGDEDFRCFCEKSEAMAIKAKIDNLDSDLIFDEVGDIYVDR